MAKVYLYKNDDGDILQAFDFRAVDRDKLIAEIAATKARLQELQTVLAHYNALATAPVGTDTEAKTALVGIDNGEGRVTFEKVNPADLLPKPNVTHGGQPLTPLVPIQPIQI